MVCEDKVYETYVEHPYCPMIWLNMYVGLGTFQNRGIYEHTSESNWNEGL